MMKDKNKYSLARKIPASTKREVRQRCGYGCVMCGGLFYQYHHFDPPFELATEHMTNGITLLCTKHHDDVTHNRISNETVKEANTNPFCLHKGNPHYLFEDLKFPFEVALGGIVFISPDGVLLKADDKELLSIKQDSPTEPPLLNAEFHSVNGEHLKIVNNEVVISAGSWDIETKNAEIKIKTDKKEVFLHLSYTPPKRLQIIKTKTALGKHLIDTEFGGKLLIHSASGATIDANSGFVVAGGGVTLDSRKGIIIDGGCLLMLSEFDHAFGGDMDYLIGQVKLLQGLSRRSDQSQ